MKLDKRLEDDCHLLGHTEVGLLLLHRNASLPWFILVPDTAETCLYRLGDSERLAAQAVWNRLAQWVHARFDSERVNMAAIGNVVAQLHLHAIGRRQDDPLWPSVAWGQLLPDATWHQDELERLRSELVGASLLVQSAPL